VIEGVNQQLKYDGLSDFDIRHWVLEPLENQNLRMGQQMADGMIAEAI